MTTSSSLLNTAHHFVDRHIGPNAQEIEQQLEATGFASMDALIEATVPASIRIKAPMTLPPAMSEQQMLMRASELAAQNKIMRPYLGMGYHRALVPPVIARNILENPAWYTQYTPYQPEISQGRLEALLNFQTMIIDLTGMEIANASLLDEGTAAAEAMSLCQSQTKGKRHIFLVSDQCHPQTISVLKTRAAASGVELIVGDATSFEFSASVFGALVQYPHTDGSIVRYDALAQAAHNAGAMLVAAADLLALTVLEAPGQWGADVVVGSSQRFGVPMGYGGPHAAFFATREDHKRRIPGRLVGVTRDVHEQPALRLALQTREQHIRRDKATSNICTSQVLLAVMAGMYGVYHGPEGLLRIAQRVKLLSCVFASAMTALGFEINSAPCFDTVWVKVNDQAALLKRAQAASLELRVLDAQRVSATFDEAVTVEELQTLIEVFANGAVTPALNELAESADTTFSAQLARTTEFMTHEVFHSYRSEHELLRYMYKLQGRDLSLAVSMIPLGSCTMKLNATAEMMPVSFPGFAQLHPFTAPKNATGYATLIHELEDWLSQITGLPAVSLQPNAGSQGEYAGLLTIRAYLDATGQTHRDICIIPSSAHGTNPASAVMAGMRVVVVACDAMGNVDLADLEQKAKKHADSLAALMVTYPSTHGVFEESILQICELIHGCGGQVYMDGANMNAQVGLCRPGDFGVDVCHLNLHKTFCIPHGGGGPGVGPIAAAEHLAPYLPGHDVIEVPNALSAGPVSAAPWGSAGILPISWMYIGMMGAQGLTDATRVAILNANYLAAKLRGAYKILYTGVNGTVAHEFILDLRPLRDATGIGPADIAKRLMDYGFHAPTMSWPVEGTLMIEPTESESKAELDRFAQALLLIREEIACIERGEADREDNVLKNAPHTATHVMAEQWTHPYTREQAAYPAAWVREAKFWPSVGRVDDAFGDRNLVCSCLPLDAYTAE